MEHRRYDDLEPDIEPRGVTRLSKGFALRDLISGTEFEITPNDKDDFDEGVNDEFEESKSAFTEESLEQYMNFSTLELDTDDKDKPICFADMRKKMTQITPDGKVMKLVKRNGLGDIVPPNALVYYHYSGHVNLEPTPFDNSYLRCNRPERFRLGKGAVILGLEIGIKTMRKGEIAQFVIEPDYAYGIFGCPPRIPPDATVCFEVELINYVECYQTEIEGEAVDDDGADPKLHSFANVLSAAKTNHLQGNDLYHRSNEKAAVIKYKKAVDLLLDVRMEDDKQEDDRNKLLIKCYTNLSICYIRMNQPRKVCIVCREAFYVDNKRARLNPKIQFNWGKALRMLNEYSRAAYHLREALKLQPNNSEIREEIQQLETKKRLSSQQEKIMFKKALGLNSNQSKTQDEQPQPDEDDVDEQLVKMLKTKLEIAKTGKTVLINLPLEVVQSVSDVCEDLVAQEGLVMKTKDGTITISKGNPE